MKEMSEEEDAALLLVVVTFAVVSSWRVIEVLFAVVAVVEWPSKVDLLVLLEEDSSGDIVAVAVAQRLPLRTMDNSPQCLVLVVVVVNNDVDIDFVGALGR